MATSFSSTLAPRPRRKPSSPRKAAASPKAPSRPPSTRGPDALSRDALPRDVRPRDVRPRDVLPRHVRPMLATLAAALPPDVSNWAFEYKWDGVRAIAYRGPGDHWLIESRNQLDITH